MRELQHYAVREEGLEMAADVVETHHLKVTPERTMLSEPRLETFDRFGPEVARHVEGSGRTLFLDGPFTKHPLKFDRLASGRGAGTYYVDFHVGPRLRWFLPGETVTEPPSLVPGSISLLRAYLDPKTGAWEPPSPELLAAFKDVVATIKKHLVSVVVRKGDKIWVGRETKRLLDAGKVIIER
jgi:hypothetical protein